MTGPEVTPTERGGGMTLVELAATAARLERCLLDAGFTDRPAMRQGLALAEEVGEFVGALRRWSGMARRWGCFPDVEAELADVVITAFVTAETLGIDLPVAVARKLDVIFSRGWREAAPDGTT